MKRTVSKVSEVGTLFLPTIGNDLQSLARAILTTSDALTVKLRDSGNLEDPYIRECLQLIRGVGNSVLPLANHLSNAAPPKEDHLSITPSAIYNLRQQLEYVRNVFSFEAHAKQIDITLTIENDIPVIFCDIDSLRIHVFNTLLSNAIRNTPVGGKIAIVVTTPDDYTMVMKISNSGGGISTLGNAPAPLKSDTSDNSNALHNARFCVLAHKGAICAIDEPGFSGSSFKIEIPLFAACMQ
jgi:signal transduction histidine kinase